MAEEMNSKISRKLLVFFALVLLVCGCDTFSEHRWAYVYTDEGGDAILVTPKFDLVLLGKKWSEGDSGPTIGNGVLVVGGPYFHNMTYKSSLNPTTKDGRRLELSLPDQKITVVRGGVVEIGRESIPLPEGGRVRIVVTKDGEIEVSDPPAAEHSWTPNFEYVRELAAKFKSQRTPLN